MSRKLIIALGLALALTLAFSGAATADEVGTSGGMCQSIDPVDGEATEVGTSGDGSGDVGTQCVCTTECGIF